MDGRQRVRHAVAIASGCCDNSAGGRVGTVVVSPSYGVNGGFRSSVPENHCSLLRTIEDAWRLPLLGHAQDAGIAPMTRYFRDRG